MIRVLNERIIENGKKLVNPRPGRNRARTA